MLKRTFTILITAFVIAGGFGCDNDNEYTTTGEDVNDNAEAGNEARDNGDRSAGEVIDDAVIVSTIKTKLLADPDISGFDIDVDSNRGEVVLTGIVETSTESAKAENIARGANGVVSVTNNLIVDPGRDNDENDSVN